ncbi:TetR/AcrR family transcriptional regulator [Lachnospiraceae bacterium LCP25S3_G4]
MSVSEKESVKERIVDAAWELFHQKGYDNTTMEDIISLSGTSKGSFYYYFDSKDALLGTLSTLLDDKYQKLQEDMDPGMNSFDKLMYLNYEMHCMMERKISHELLASMYSSQLVTKGERHLLDQNRTYYRLISSIVEEGQKRGQITADKTVSEVTKIYSLCERALVSDWCLSKGDYSLGEYSKEYMPLLFKTFRGKEK